MQEIKILHEPSEKEPYIVLHKPRGLPSAPLHEGDSENAFSKAATIFPVCFEVSGIKNVEHGLLHRLDTETEGLLLVAASQDFYDFLKVEQDSGRFIKTYRAKCDILNDNAEALGGFPLSPIKKDRLQTLSDMEISSMFRNYGEKNALVRPVTKDSGKAGLKKCKCGKIYSTKISVSERKKNEASVECRIEKGYRHQVRAHLAWIGLPVKGDRLYNFNCVEKVNAELLFFATEIEFRDFITRKTVHFRLEL